MFPFPTDLTKYTAISSGDANARRELIGESYSFCIPLNRDQLPEALQNIKTLVTGFVSGVRDGVPSPVGSGKMLEVNYTVRYDAKDAPVTGNANAYCILEVGEKFYMSPPCHKLGDIPHHFQGRIPFELHVDPKVAEEQGINVMTTEEMNALFAEIKIQEEEPSAQAQELPEQTQSQQPEQ